MLTSYFRLAIRTFLKNKIPFLINLIGMSIALGCCITAYVNSHYAAEFDSMQENAANIYRIGFWQKSKDHSYPYGVTPMPVGNLIRETLGEGEQVIQYISKGAQFRIGDDMFQSRFMYVDPIFTKIFSIDLLHGTLDLKDKSQILISDKLAKTYYNSLDVVGQPLTQIISGMPRDYVVSGVYKAFPFNSSFTSDLITSYDNYFEDIREKAKVENDWSRWTTTFLYLNGSTPIASINTQLANYIQTQNEARPDLMASEFYVEPFIGMASRAQKQRNQGHWMNMPLPPAAVVSPFAMSGLLLLVACFNFMNNAIAVAGNRLKEIGIRKVIGGRRKELILQFLSETFIFCFFSMLLSLVLAEYFTAGWNSIWAGLEIKIRYADNMVLFIVLGALLLFTALLAGGYSAFYISSFKPIQVLKGTTQLGGGNLLTKSLLVFQFSISLAAVIFALAFYTNSKFQKEYDLGYSYNNVVQVPLDNPQQFEQLKNVLATNSKISSISGSQHHIYTSSYTAAIRAENQIEKEVDVLNVGDHYFETVNVRLIAGREFGVDRSSDMEESIIVNEEFTRVFNLGADAVGKRMMMNDSIPIYIVGVVKDVYLRALFEPLAPVAFRYVPVENYNYLIASTTPAQLIEVNGEIKKAWQELYPTMLYTGKLMEQDMVMVLEHFDSVVLLYTFLGIVAIIMSVSGLYSLVSLNLQKRTKEFGIRKILGASLSHMTLQASQLFLIIMVVSFVVGSLMGTIMVNGLMSTVWEYYEAINVQVISMAIIILFIIAMATIGFKILKVTKANPVDSLRYE